MKKIKKETVSNVIKKADGFYKVSPFFSLKYVDETNKKFSFRLLSNLKLAEIILNLKKLSQKTWEEIKNTDKYYRFHKVDIEKVSKILKYTNMKDEEKYNIQIFQFKPIANDKKLRIFGFFNSNFAFEIIWFDREHEVYE